MKNMYIVLLFLSLIIASCNQSSSTKQSEEQISTQRNRTDSIAFMGVQLGVSNESIEAIIDSSHLVTKIALPDRFNRYLGSSNNSIFDNPEEKIISTFFTQIIDKKNNSHDGWGIVKSDCDSTTTIQIIMPDCDDVVDVYNKIKELYIERYGEPDQSYEGEVIDYLQNTGCYWEFPDSQRITLNRCEYSGTAGYEGGIDWGSRFRAFERVEVAYQSLKAIQRLKQKEEQAEKERQKAEKERIDANRKARESQQL